jgi:hypothetical protein
MQEFSQPPPALQPAVREELIDISENASHVLVLLGSGMNGESETMQSLSRLEILPDHFSFASRQDQEIAQRVEL